MNDCNLDSIEAKLVYTVTNSYNFQHQSYGAHVDCCFSVVIEGPEFSALQSKDSVVVAEVNSLSSRAYYFDSKSHIHQRQMNVRVFHLLYSDCY